MFFAICTIKRQPDGRVSDYVADEHLGIYRSRGAAEARLTMLRKDELQYGNRLAEMQVMPIKIQILENELSVCTV
jgi:hypothetical protein